MFRNFIIIIFVAFAVSACLSKNVPSHHERDNMVKGLEKEINQVTNSFYGHIILKYDLLDLDAQNLSDKGSANNKHCVVSPLYTSLLKEQEIDRYQLQNLILRLRSNLYKTDTKKLLQKAEQKSAEKLTLVREFASISPVKISNNFTPKTPQVADNKAKLSLKNVFSVLDIDVASNHGHKTKASLEELNYLESEMVMIPTITPVDNFIVTSTYGNRKDPIKKVNNFHRGIDLQAQEDGNIYNPAPGTVSKVSYDRGYGHYLDIDHGRGVSTRFAHLDKVLVSKGQSVQLGKLLGKQGNSGKSTKDHLHYEVRYKNTPIDPSKLMKFLSQCK